MRKPISKLTKSGLGYGKKGVFEESEMLINGENEIKVIDVLFKTWNQCVCVPIFQNQYIY